MGMHNLTPTERRLRREARSAAMRRQALALREAGVTYAAIARALGLSLERARRIVKRAEWLRSNPHWSDALPARAQYFLHTRGWFDLDEVAAARHVAQLSRRELMRTPNFGAGACSAIVAWLARHGLNPRPESSELQEFLARSFRGTGVGGNA